MQLRPSKGRMFKSVDWTATYYQGCNHGCKVCWTLFMPGGPISHEPRLMQTDEFQVLRRREGVCFLNSAHDSFAACIPDEWIRAMLRWIRRQHEGLVVYLQSQNIGRAQQFMPELKEIQDKIILGTTLQTDIEAIVQAISNAPSIYSRYQGMLRLKTQGFRLRLSLEPLYLFTPTKLRDMVFDINPELVETGLDNYAARHKLVIPQPHMKAYCTLYRAMKEYGIEVFEKDSIKKWRNWRKR